MQLSVIIRKVGPLPSETALPRGPAECDQNMYTRCQPNIWGYQYFPMQNHLFSILNGFIFLRHNRQIRKFVKRVGYKPNVAAPRKYHELMIWRKIFDRNPLFITFCDKLATKAYIASRIPEAVLPETLWVGRDIADIPKELRHADVVLKANHGSSFNYFGPLDNAHFEELQAITKKWLGTDYGRDKGEWAYAKVPRRLFLERRLFHPAGEKLVDVSVRCSNGRAILASATTDNKTARKRFGYFRLDGQRCWEFEAKDPENEKLPLDFMMPASFPLAVEYAKRLSVGVDYARYDFLCVGDKIYPGEITVFPGAGLTHADDDGIDAVIVDGWDAGQSWFLQTPWTGWRKRYAEALREHFQGLR